MTYRVVIRDIARQENDMHRIGYLLSDGFQIMALASQTVFEMANDVSGEAFYGIEN